jgi:nitrite reductase/ring-hydroxylating ferredoxin subunit
MDTVNETGSTPTHVVCALAQVPDGGATAMDAVLAEGEESLILLRRGGQINGYLNVCPHAGNRLDYAPCKLLLKIDSLICAVLGAVFYQADGRCPGGPCLGQSLRAVPLRVVDGVVCHDPAALA